MQVADTHWDMPGGQKEAEQRLEDDTVAMILERLLDAKPSLFWHFTRQVLLPSHVLVWQTTTAYWAGALVHERYI